MEDTGLYTVDGKKIMTESIDNSDPETFENFIEDIKVNHPLQWLNLMSTNIDTLIREYNEVAFNNNEVIIAAVFVDNEEPEYEAYRGMLTQNMTEDIANAEDEDTDAYGRDEDAEESEPDS